MAVLRAVGLYIPTPRHTAADIAQASGIPESVVRDKMGIVEKPVPGDDDHTNAMGIRAAREALHKAGVAAGSVDVLISITEKYQEYVLQSPGIAAAHLLGCHRAWAYDLGQRCGAGVLALKQARDLLIADPRVNVVLICGGYRNGDLVDYQDPATRFLFNLSAGGAAAVVTRDGAGFELLESAFAIDGSFADDVIIPVGGTREPARPDNLDQLFFRVRDYQSLKERLEARSMALFEQVIRQACEHSGMAPGELAHLALPHFKPAAHRAVLARLGVAAERSLHLAHYGHMGQLDPLLSLQLACDERRIAPGAAVVLASAGIGYVWNAIACRRTSD